MGYFSDLFGTVRSTFKLGITGVLLKNSAGNLQVRNNADNADANITTLKLLNSSDALQLNSSATQSAASWRYDLARPAAGMSANQTLTMPAGLGTAGQAIVTDGAGNLSYASTASTASLDHIDTTSLAFGTASPLAMFSTGAADIIDEVEIIVDTAFNGTPSLSIGITGTTSKYMSATDIDLTAAASTTFKVHPGLPAAGAEALIATYSAGGASAGAARILVHFAAPQ